MRLLVLGGTRFVGRHAVEAALRAGHEVTLFNRGISGGDLFPGVRALIGERGGDHAALKAGTWDAVVDACGYRPAEVRAAAAALRGRCGHYLFISTVSAYAEFEKGGDEGAPLWRPAEEGYGPLKVACEDALTRDWGAKLMIARPGLVAGPYDHTDRFTYWPVRLARGGRVLTPALDKPAQFTDARDFGAWLVASAAAGRTGTFNCVGNALPFGELLDACGGGDYGVASDDFLVENGVAPYTDLPLWIPGRVAPFDGAKARAAGFVSRPVADTARDALAWRRASGEPALNAGLSAAREAALLRALA